MAIVGMPQRQTGLNAMSENGELFAAPWLCIGRTKFVTQTIARLERALAALNGINYGLPHETVSFRLQLACRIHSDVSSVPISIQQVLSAWLVHRKKSFARKSALSN
jgi:hypothetical protein